MIKKSFFESLKRKWYFYVILLVLVGMILVLEIAPAKLLEGIINSYLEDSSAVKRTIIILSVLYVSAIVLSSLCDFIKQILLTILGEEFSYSLKKNMSLKLKRLDSSCFADEDAGVISSRFTSDVDQIHSFFSEGIISMGIDLLKVIVILAEMFLYSWYLGVLTLVFIPIIFFISHGFRHLMFKAQMKSRRMTGLLNNNISEAFSNQRMLKMYSKEDYMIKKNDEYLAEDYKAGVRVSLFDGAYSPIIQILTAAVISILVITTNLKSLSIGLSIGALAGAIEYVSQLFAPVEALGMELQSIQKAASGLERVREFFHKKEEAPQDDISLSKILKNDITMEFRNVSFSYLENSHVLEDITFKAEGDMKVSFVGRTGVGKTTMFRLMEGELQPSSGEVLLNGMPAYRIPNDLKSRIYGYVSQKFSALEYETIRRNITMKNERITDEMVLQALDTVGLLQKILSLPEGLDTVYQDSLFSQGEKSLLGIARAIAPNPRILLLDEMTASLDSETEKKVLKALEKSSSGRMILEISHRISTTLDSDVIISMKDGRILASESPSEFLKRDWVRHSLRLEKSW